LLQSNTSAFRNANADKRGQCATKNFALLHQREAPTGVAEMAETRAGTARGRGRRLRTLRRRYREPEKDQRQRLSSVLRGWRLQWRRQRGFCRRSARGRRKKRT